MKTPEIWEQKGVNSPNINVSSALASPFLGIMFIIANPSSQAGKQRRPSFHYILSNEFTVQLGVPLAVFRRVERKFGTPLSTEILPGVGNRCRLYRCGICISSRHFWSPDKVPEMSDDQRRGPRVSPFQPCGILILQTYHSNMMSTFPGATPNYNDESPVHKTKDPSETQIEHRCPCQRTENW
jgi:hypothetical protein